MTKEKLNWYTSDSFKKLSKPYKRYLITKDILSGEIDREDVIWCSNAS